MADVEHVVASLTLEEKARLTAGGDMFATTAVERLGIPRVNVTDGPSGARGQSFPGSAAPRRAASRAGRPSAPPGIPASPRRSARSPVARPWTAGASVCSHRHSTFTGRLSPAGTSSATRRTRCSPAASAPPTSAESKPKASSPPRSTSWPTKPSSSG